MAEDKGVRRVGMVMVCFLTLMLAFAAPGLGQTSTDPIESDIDSSQEQAPTYELPPIDPEVLAGALARGESAAATIRSRIRELAQARIDVASEENSAALALLDSATRTLRMHLLQLQVDGADLDELQFTHREVVRAYDEARATLARHLAALYVVNPALVIANDFLRTGDLDIDGQRSNMIRAVLEHDRATLLQTYVAAAASSPDIDAMAAAVRDQSGLVRSLGSGVALAQQVQASEFSELAGIATMANDWLFSVAGDHNFSDTFLAPRMSGTRNAHRHQGVDVFADEWTPLVAGERGVVGRVGEVGLAGLRVWLLGESGTNYYYAHLSEFAEGLEPGQFVETGAVLGLVSNTGNAVNTPPHVHFQIHLDGGVAVNPTPLLTQTSRRDEDSGSAS